MERNPSLTSLLVPLRCSAALGAAEPWFLHSWVVLMGNLAGLLWFCIAWHEAAASIVAIRVFLLPSAVASSQNVNAPMAFLMAFLFGHCHEVTDHLGAFWIPGCYRTSHRLVWVGRGTYKDRLVQTAAVGRDIFYGSPSCPT